jgi:tetratricopeptide (TPR) repeat protein
MSLDMPDAQPAPSGGGVVTFGQSSGPAPAQPPSAVAARFARKPAHDENINLDLDEAPTDGPALRRPAPERKAKRTKLAPTDKKKFGKKQKMLAGVLGLALVGGGGIYALQVMQGEQAKGEAVAALGKGAAKHLASDAPGHWDKAIAEANRMHKSDPKSFEALALLAEARYAAAMDNGTGAAAQIQAGAAAVTKMRQLRGQGARVSLAEGLHALAAMQLDDAIRHLTAGVTADKKNPSARLYLAWAYAAKHDHHNAIGSYDAALTIMPNRIAALYGKAVSLVAIGKHKEANESFLAAIKTYRELYKSDHIGSLLGIAQLASVENFGDREKRYLEILNREDIAEQDPRMVAKAWALAGDEARKAGRLGVASEAYATAQKLDINSMEAAVGQAAVDYVKGNTAEAAEKLNGILAMAPGHLDAALLYIEVAVAQEDSDRASDKLADLFELKPPIESKPTLSRMQLLKGRIMALDEANASDAESAYKQAIDLSPDGGVEASLELAELYNRLQRPEEAGAILAPLQARAKKDPALAVVLGVAYLGTGDPAQAIALFRLALSQHPADAEARFQLGRALANGDRADEAITELTRAYKDSEQREDIGLELAEIYGRLERFDEANELFEKILASESPSRNARAYAGHYFARRGDIEKANGIGEGLLADNEKDPAGLYLTGEGLFQADKWEDARDLFLEASKIEALPQYLEALGRSYKALQDYTKGVRAYERAIKLDPKYIKPRLGLADIHFARKEFSTVLKDLQPALEIDPRIVQIHYQIGRSHLEMRDIDAALAALQKAIEADANHGLSHMAIGLAHNAKGDAKSAVGAFARATRTTGNNEAEWLPEAYRLLGYAIRESGGDKSAQRDAWENYIDRVEIEDDQSKEVKKLLIPLQRR